MTYRPSRRNRYRPCDLPDPIFLSKDKNKLGSHQCPKRWTPNKICPVFGKHPHYLPQYKKRAWVKHNDTPYVVTPGLGLATYEFQLSILTFIHYLFHQCLNGLPRPVCLSFKDNLTFFPFFLPLSQLLFNCSAECKKRKDRLTTF